MCIHKVNQKLAKYEDVGICHHGIEGILQERLQPTPKQPLELGHNEERDKNGPEHNGDRRSYVSKCNNHKDCNLSCLQGNNRNLVPQHFEDIDRQGKARLFGFVIDRVQPCSHLRHDAVIQLVCKVCALINDQVVEAES